MSQEKTTNILRNKDFMLLFFGGLVSRIGNSIHYVAITWFVLDTTGSGTATGTILFLSTLPGVLLGPFSGVIADRINRKFLIVGMDVVRGLIVIWLGWSVYAGSATFASLALATVLIAISSSLFNPAVSATLPNLVEDHNLQKANSLQHFSMQSTSIIGAATGGILIAIFGVAGVFFIDGISYLLSAVSELFINIPPVKRKAALEQSSFMEDLKFGAGFLFKNRTLFSLFGLSIFLNFLFAGVFMVGLPFLFKEVLGVSSKLFGFSQAFFPVGAIIGALLLSLLPEVKNYYRVIFIPLIIQSVLLLLMGVPIIPGLDYPLLTIYISLSIILVASGIFNSICNVPISVLLQRLIPDDIRGRVYGLLGTINQGLVPISMAFVGWLLDIIPGYFLFMSAGSLSLLVMLGGFRLPALRNINAVAAEISTEKIQTDGREYDRVSQPGAKTAAGPSAQASGSYAAAGEEQLAPSEI